MTIATRRINKEVHNRAEKFLQQAGLHMKDNMYCYQLEVQGGADDGLTLDACIDLQGNKLVIKTIWVIEYNPKKGMLSARNDNGERGSYAKILAEKYFNRFFDHLETVDIDNVDERQYFVLAGNKLLSVIGSKENLEGFSPVEIDINDIKELENTEEQGFLLLPEHMVAVEAEIDRSINPKQITESDVASYNRFELTLFGEQALEWFCNKLEEKDFDVSYDKDSQVFEIELCTSELHIKVPLEDVVRKKWEMGEGFQKALIACAGDLYVSADKRKKMEEAIVKGLLDHLMPILQKFAEKGPETLDELVHSRTKILKLQAMFYCEGREHSETGYDMLTLDEFLDYFDESDPVRHATHIVVDRFYGSYISGFDGTIEIPA